MTLDEETGPRPRYIRYDHDRKQRWKIVPVWYVVRIANRSTKGADWAGCPKNHIIGEFEKSDAHQSHKIDRDLFGSLMDKATTAMRKVRRFQDETMGQIFKETP